MMQSIKPKRINRRRVRRRAKAPQGPVENQSATLPGSDEEYCPSSPTTTRSNLSNIPLYVNELTAPPKFNIAELMSLPTQATELEPGSFFVNFNQDCTSLAVGSKTGYRLFSLLTTDKLEQIYESDAEDTCIVERLFSSSLMAIVSLASPRKLKVCHFRKGTEICNYSYSNTILAVKLNRARLVVCLEESLYIHNIRDMKVLHTIRDTPPNLSGLCTLSINSDSSYLAYPGSNTIGEVQIFDATNLQAKTMIPAHDSPLAALAFSPCGGKVATASEKGTVIRVFHVQEGTKLFEFRRGMKRCVSISSLSFSMDSAFLCCSSNTETVHIFKLEEPKETSRQSQDESQSWMGYLTKAVSASANYLPSQVTDVFNQGRAFASVHLPFQGLKNVCAIATIQKVLRLLVASADGYLYIYNFDTIEGGDCTLLRQHRLDGKQDEVDGTSASSSAENPVTATTSAPIVQNPPACINSYAGVLRGRSPDSMSGIGISIHSAPYFIALIPLAFLLLMQSGTNSFSIERSLFSINKKSSSSLTKLFLLRSNTLLFSSIFLSIMVR